MGDEKILGKKDGKTEITIGWEWTPVVQGDPSKVSNAISAIEKAAQSEQFKTALTNAGQELAYLNGPDFQKFWDADGKKTDEAVVSIGKQ